MNLKPGDRVRITEDISRHHVGRNTQGTIVWQAVFQASKGVEAIVSHDFEDWIALTMADPDDLSLLMTVWITKSQYEKVECK